MDPKQNANQPLDPQLQQVYDRVMGVNVSGQPATPPTPATSQPTPPPTAPTTEPTGEPTAPTTPPMPENPVTPVPPVENPPTNPAPSQPTPPMSPAVPQTDEGSSTNPSTDALNVTMNMPNVVHRDTDTVKIGIGGSPVAAAKAKGKGISPVILILGAFVFLIIYAIFWIRFFGYSIPFISQ